VDGTRGRRERRSPFTFLLGRKKIEGESWQVAEMGDDIVKEMIVVKDQEGMAILSF
jgi:hypothetical protein